LYQFKEDSIFGELVDIGAEVAQEIPGGKLAISLLARLSNRVAQWYQSRGIKILACLDAMGGQQVAAELPMFLGFDVTTFLVDHPQRRPVVLLDTYEALWRQPNGDSWLRRFAEETPGCLIVTTGRRRIAWEEYDPDWSACVVCRSLGALNEQEADALLDAGEVKVAAVRAALRQAAAGHPLSLVVGIRYYQIRQLSGSEPTADELPRTHQEILNQFFDHLDIPVRGLMRALAVPSAIRKELWGHFARSGFSAFDLYDSIDIFNEVFFQRISTDIYVMHEVVREHLLSDLARKDADFLRRVRLAAFDFYDRACSTDKAARDEKGIPDLSISIVSRDECMAEAASHLLLASPERYIQWCADRLSDDRRGSKQYTELVDHAHIMLGELGPQTLLDAAIVARLEVSVDPWSRRGIELVTRITELIEHIPLTTSVMEELLPVVRHFRAANPDALQKSLMQAMLISGCQDVGTALAAGDLETAVRLVTQNIESRINPSSSWDELVTIARSMRPDLVKRLAIPFQKADRDLCWLGHLARIIDTFNYLDRPDFGVRVIETAFDTDDHRAVVQSLLQHPPSVVVHQVTLSLFEALARCGDWSNAHQLAVSRFGSGPQQSLVEGLSRLEAAGIAALSTEDGKEFINTLETKHGLQGFFQGYLEALLSNDDFVKMLPSASRAAIDFEVRRSRKIYENIGGHPTYSTLRKVAFNLVRNDRGGYIVFVNDNLILWRPVDWIAFYENMGFRFKDTRQGTERHIGLLLSDASIKSRIQASIGDGASLLVVVMDDQGDPIHGEYISFFGRSW
jgi:hypothetical protein